MWILAYVRRAGGRLVVRRMEFGYLDALDPVLLVTVEEDEDAAA
jgi:hypothetical protein